MAETDYHMGRDLKNFSYALSSLSKRASSSSDDELLVVSSSSLLSKVAAELLRLKDAKPFCE
uniref:Uncharacterized protein n=1 Tax=Romanomermis culicivorax TaxID=13658 RepID=A0A915JN80_ROMCU